MEFCDIITMLRFLKGVGLIAGAIGIRFSPYLAIGGFGSSGTLFLLDETLSCST